MDNFSSEWSSIVINYPKKEDNISSKLSFNLITLSRTITSARSQVSPFANVSD